MSAESLALEWLPGRYAVCRLAAGAEMPQWAISGGGLVSITRTDDELSIVAPEFAVLLVACAPEPLGRAPSGTHAFPSASPRRWSARSRAG